MARTPSAQLEAKILDAARHLLATDGAGAVTQRAVATAAGVSPQSIYNRFASKHELLDEIADDGFRRLTDQLLVADGLALVTIEDPIANIVEGLRRYRRFAIEHPHLYGLMFDAPIPDFSVSDRTLATAFASLRVLVDAVQRAIDAEVVRADDALAAAQQLWAAAHGVLRFELTGVGFVDEWPRHYDATVATVLRGLASGADDD